ncbi:hypothetical protein MAHJHV58_29320 [Mycobacterium avium subsp. hominissuis]|uniref:Uncharacterized protein n=2 Tax=Mycobacterium avium TaxID=1764 RepID=A0A3B6XCV8_MYCAV|nr:hypothetical protein DFS55_19480 [Mycobacterium avium subsp. hominissuis]PBA13344.1 hypothetical protein CKJ70_06035 [Mycobacterium avium]PBA42681.1 hypothetical protein CKJ63_05670 [Mycobacterium avium]PBA72563.1 hypothetical protein CKJ76_05430 [Mycobacterium avium]PBA84276.1 hypothetical protein CKJ72_06430 [Mycobacterium avium]
MRGDLGPYLRSAGRADSEITRRPGTREEKEMNREVSKFFCGAFAGIAYAHAGYAIAASAGIIDEPIFLGRKWGVGFMWTEAVVYTAISAALGYAGWRSPPATPREVSAPATDGQAGQPVSAAKVPLSTAN